MKKSAEQPQLIAVVSSVGLWLAAKLSSLENL